jgi:hypothetical protein
MRLHVQIGLALACAAFMAQARAQTGPQDGPFIPDNAVAATTLEGLRGGFTTDTGLAVTLGLERIVTINGNIAEQTKIDFGDLGKLTSGQATLSADAIGQLRLIQNGVGNNLSVQFGQNTLGGTVIQNTLNDQLINNQTIINASVNARGMLQTMNFQSTLANALNTAAIGH